jgi:hypothetical protein
MKPRVVGRRRSGRVEAAFVFDAGGAVLGSGAFSGRHRQSPIGTRWRAVRKHQRPGGVASWGKNSAPVGVV